MQLPGPGVMGPPRDHDEAVAVLRRVIEAGVNHIDTAQYYGPNVSNELIHEALHPYPDDLVIVSKVGAERDAKGGWVPAQQPAEAAAGCRGQSAHARADHLGAVNLRLMEDPASVPEADGRCEDQLAEMAALRDEGKILGVGISTASLDQVRQAHESVGLACVQNAFSLLSTETIKPVLDYCVGERHRVRPVLPARLGVPGLPKVTDDPEVQERGRREGRDAGAGRSGLAARRWHPTSASSRVRRRWPTWPRTWPSPTSSSVPTTSIDWP